MIHGLKELRLRTYDGEPAAHSLLLWRHIAQEDCDPPSIIGHTREPEELVTVAETPQFQLQRFHWGCHSEQDDVSRFLRTQHNLRELFVEWDLGRYTGNFVNSLDFIGGNRPAIEEFLRDRYIPRVAWIPADDDSLEPLDGNLAFVLEFKSVDSDSYRFEEKKFQRLQDALKKVRVLEFVGCFGGLRFKSIARYFEGLEVLELVGYDDEVRVSRIP